MPQGVKRSVGERKKLNKEPREIGAFWFLEILRMRSG